jgi:glycosyltransferase involved in cell wall biosynthesis
VNPTIVIPAYQPDKPLLSLVSALTGRGYSCIVVDDGSSSTCDPIFSQLKNIPTVTLLKHAVNLGKGQALKTAFNYYLNEYSNEAIGIITADADGQHHVDDIVRVSNQLVLEPNKLWLGVREFDGVVPFRSAFGNSLTKKVFQFFTGQKISDTQTGLRGIPNSLMKKMLKVSSNGYEFELEMLIKAGQSQVAIAELPIKTIYENNNASSHFNPILDSAKIYFVFIRFSALSIATAILDFTVFVFAQILFSNILISAVCGRVVAGFFNFSLGKLFVFHSKSSAIWEFGKYILTVLVLGLISFELIDVITENLHLNVYVSKIIAETGLFLVSFAIQRTFVFSTSKDE